MSDLNDTETVSLNLVEAIKTYSHIIVLIGLLVNSLSLTWIMCNKRRYNCFPLLTCLLVGNLVFLLSYGVNMLANVQAWSCHLPTLCVAVISFDRYFSLFHSSLYVHMLAAHSHGTKRRQRIMVLFLCSGCLALNVWLLPMVTSSDGHCLIDAEKISQRTEQILTSLTVMLTYFVPYLLMLVCQLRLLCALYCCAAIRQGNQVVLAQNSTTSVPDTSQFRSRTSSLVLSEQLARMLRRKRNKTMFVLVFILIVDLSLNFPNHLLNLALKFGYTGNPELTFYVHTGAYMLWHLQFVTSAMLVHLRFFVRASDHHDAGATPDHRRMSDFLDFMPRKISRKLSRKLQST